MSKTSKTQTDKPLQQQMDELSELVEQLEDPNLPLESALKLYESGMEIVRSAQTALDTAEQRVALINEQGEAAPLEP